MQYHIVIGIGHDFARTGEGTGVSGDVEPWSLFAHKANTSLSTNFFGIPG
jgi:hypothetical protein